MFETISEIIVKIKETKLFTSFYGTQLPDSISWVALFSLVRLFVIHLRLSPPYEYDVLDHTNHIFSESLLCGDDIDQDKDTGVNIL